MSNKTFHSFQEYMTDRGKVVSKPPVESTPTYKGPKPKSPAKAATKGKGWEVPNVGKKGRPGAYKSGTDKAPKKAEKGGFADMGDKSLVYEPGDTAVGGTGSVSKSEQGMPGGSKKTGWPKGGSKTESFLAATKGMSTSQFAKHVKKGLNEHCGCENKKAPHVVAYSVGAFHPDPIQAIRYVTYLANENVNLRHALVREAKRAGCAAGLLGELLQLPESYVALAKLLDSKQGEVFSRRLEKAVRENREELRKKAKLHEEVDEPAHDDDMKLDDIDTDETEDGEDDLDPDNDPDLNPDADEDPDGGDDPDLDSGDEKSAVGDLDLGSDEDGPDADKGGLNLGGEEGDEDDFHTGGETGDDKGGLNLGSEEGDDEGGLNLGGEEGDEGPPEDPHAGNTHLGDDDEEEDAPPPDEEDGKIDFDDDEEDEDDLDLEDDDEDDDDLDMDDEDEPKKMPWDED